jgi:hypothetical protein
MVEDLFRYLEVRTLNISDSIQAVRRENVKAYTWKAEMFYENEVPY